MEALVDFFEMGVGDMGIDLCGGDVGVAEERLDRTEVGAVHEEVGGERVSQGVGRNVFGDAGFFGVFFDEALDGTGGEATIVARGVGGAVVAAIAKEKRSERVGAGGEIFAKAIGGGLRDEDRAIFAAFAANHEFAAVEVDTIAVEADELGDAETGREEKFDDGAVAETGFGVEIDFV